MNISARSAAITFLAATAILSAGDAKALTFSFSYDSSVATDFGSNTTSMTNAMAWVAQNYESMFSNPITINITIYAIADQIVNGANDAPFLKNLSYSQVRNALITDATNNPIDATKQTSVANLPLIDPSGTNDYAMTTAEAKALGLLSGSATESNGTITFASYPANSNGYTFDPYNRAGTQPFEIDFIGDAEHEISEVMGRAAGPGVPYDLFRFNQNTTTRNIARGSNVWFSYDGGQTDLLQFNPQSVGDPQDWAGPTADSFNAFDTYGENDISAVDKQVMDVLGYDLVVQGGPFWSTTAPGTNWITPANWLGGVPGPGDTARFNGASYAHQPFLSSAGIVGGIWVTGRGAVTIGGGTLTLVGGNTINGNPTTGIEVDAGAGALTLNAPVYLQNDQQWINNSVNPITVSGGIQGPGALTKLGSGVLTLSGSNTFATYLTVDGGAINMPSGFLSAGYAINIGYSATGSFTQSGGTNSVGVQQLTLGYNRGTSGSYSLGGNGQISGPAAATEVIGLDGIGNFTQLGGTNSVGTVVLGENNGSAGIYSLYGGLLSISTSAGSIGDGNGAATFTLDGGTLDMNGGGIFVGAFNAQSGRLRNVSGIYANGIPGLVKSPSVVGNSVLYLSGTNTYAGPTTVNAGVLVADSGLALSATSTGTVTLNGGILSAGATGGMIAGPVVAGSGAPFIVPGFVASPGYATLNLFGGLTTNGNTYFEFKMNTASQIATGGNGLPIFGGDLIDLGNSALNVGGGYLTFDVNPTAGDYRLFAYGSVYPTGLSNFILPIQPGETYALSTSVDPGHVDLVASTVASWNSTVSGSWGAGGNWSPTTVPNSGTVTFPALPGTTAPITVRLDGDRTVGGLVFSVSNTNGYTLSQGTYGTLTVGTGAGGSIAVFGGAHAISAPVKMAGNLTVSTNSGTSLQLSGGLSESTAGSALIVSGGGQVILSGAGTFTGGATLNGSMLVISNGGGSATGNGSVTLNGGILAAGPAGGTISGQVLAGSGPHTIAPGAALSSGYGTLNLSGGLTTNTNTTLLFNTGGELYTGGNGLPVFGGDLINLGNSALNASSGGYITFTSNPQTPGDYRLFQYGSVAPINLNNLTLPMQTGWAYSLLTGVDNGYIDLVATAAASNGATWNSIYSGSWNDSSNWSPQTVPNSGPVTFPAVPGTAAPVTVMLDGPQSAGALAFNVDTGNGYTLAPGSNGTLTLGTGAAGSIAVYAGAHTISAPLVMAGNLAVSTASGTSLEFSGGLSESTPGSALTVSGSGQVILSSAGSYTGGTTLTSGMLVANSGISLSATGTGAVTLSGGTLAAGPYGGTISGAVNAGNSPHTIAPGAGVPVGYGTLNLVGGLTTNNYTTLLFNTGGQVGTGGNGPIFGGDLINLGNSALDASLSGSIAFVNNPTLAGDYRLFQYGSASPINLGNLTLPVQSGETYLLSTAVDPGFVDLVAAAVAPAGPTWNSNLSGSWTVGSNWLPTAVPSGGTLTFPDVPGTTAPVTVMLDGDQSAGGLVFNVSSSNGYTLAQGSSGALTLGSGPRAGGSIAVLGGSHTVSAPLVMDGDLAVNTAGGTSLQFSGSVSESASAPQSSLILSGQGLVIFSGTGSYTGNTTINGGTLQIIAGAQLPAYSEFVAVFGNASVVQTGGTSYVNNYLEVGLAASASGSYCLSGGLLSAGEEYCAYYGLGSFAQSGGTNTTNYLQVGAANQGSYCLTGGLLSAANESIGGFQGQYSGSFAQTGGTNMTSSVSVGDSGSGAATYKLSGTGQLAAQYEYIGSYSQSGVFTQCGGSNSASVALFVGNGSGGNTSGTYNLAGGNLSAALETIGQDTSGIFAQTGGSNTAGSLVLGQNSGSAGTYNLNGGLLRLGSLSQGSGSATFNCGGGTFQAASSFSTSVPMFFTTAGSNAVFDTDGNALTLAGDLSGPGGLEEIGAGLLVLSGDNIYGGGTTVSSGTLEVDSSSALPPGSSLTVGADASLVFGGADLAGTGMDDLRAGDLRTVPEPSTLGLVVAAAAIVASYRLRKRQGSRSPRRSDIARVDDATPGCDNQACV